jgi:DMSO reductase family type II enzyme heme b subunit
MKCHKVNHKKEDILNLDSPVWKGVEVQKIALDSTPINTIPTSKYIAETIERKNIGKVKSIEVKSIHNGKEIFFWCRWQDDIENREITDVNTFLDGFGMMFPLKGDAKIEEMGSKKEPVNLWYWRADFEEKPHNLTAAGIGSTQTTEKSFLFSKSKWEKGYWTVVVGRPLEVKEQLEEAVQFKPGETIKVGWAVMEGSNNERGGAMSFSVYFRNLDLDNGAQTAAREG